MPSSDTESCERHDKHFLQPSQVAGVIDLGQVCVLVHSPERNQRVSDQLPGTMIGHVAATVHPADGQPPLFELIFIQQQVLLLSAPPKGVDVRMLQQEQCRRAFATRDLPGDAILKCPGFIILHKSEANNVAGCFQEQAF